MRIVAAVRTLVYMLVFYPGSVGFVTAACLAIPFGQDVVIPIPRGWARFHRWCMRWLLGIRIVFEGELPQSNVIVAVKHEAMLETTEILLWFARPAVVFKAELLRIPLWGAAAIAHGVIPVARETGATALRRMLTAARAAVAAGRPIVIFPEGTRIAHGTRAALRPGIVGLQKTLGLPIVPVAVNSGTLWPRDGWIKHSGVVTFRAGAPIAPGGARDVVEAQLADALNALNS